MTLIIGCAEVLVVGVNGFYKVYIGLVLDKL